MDVDTANAEVLKWLRNTANLRIHGTTREVPAERLKFEMNNLSHYHHVIMVVGLPYRRLRKTIRNDSLQFPCSIPYQYIKEYWRHYEPAASTY